MDKINKSHDDTVIAINKRHIMEPYCRTGYHGRFHL